MKYHKERDNDSRYLRMDIDGRNPYFKANINLTFPSPSYKYELTDKELSKFSQKLMIKWSEEYNKLLQELLTEDNK